MTPSLMQKLALFVLCVSVSILSGCAVKVPGVAGLTQTAALALITDAGLTAGMVTEEHSETVPVGLVISQTPAFGGSAAPGTAVDLVISLGSATVAVMLPGDVLLEMVWIPAGSFVMGSPDTEEGRDTNEGPPHTVTLGGFWMGKYELTKRQWSAVMPTTPWAGQPGVFVSLESPAVCLSWNDAQGFIAALNGLTGKTFRLPSEAEWEYACRAGTTTRYYWGDDPTFAMFTDYAWWINNTWIAGEAYAHLVGQKLMNAFGLHDMSGNVFEWTEDDRHDSYTGAPPDGSAWIDSPRTTEHFLRGGSWSHNGGIARSATRLRYLATLGSADFGLRLAGS